MCILKIPIAFSDYRYNAPLSRPAPSLANGYCAYDLYVLVFKKLLLAHSQRRSPGITIRNDNMATVRPDSNRTIMVRRRIDGHGASRRVAIPGNGISLCAPAIGVGQPH